MSITWKIAALGTSVGSAATLASMGIQNLRRTYRANGPGDLVFSIPSATALTATSPIVAGTTYVIWRNDVPWHVGKCLTNPRYASQPEERIDITLADPWHHFRSAYLQTWKIWDEDGEALVHINQTRVVLFQKADGTRANTGEQIADIIDSLIARGAPIQKGTIDSGPQLPFDERVNLSSADAYDAVLRWIPDYVAWFDFTTYHEGLPTPTFHCRRRANLTAVSIAVTVPEDLRIEARTDLQIPGVHITYEKTHQVDPGTGNAHTYRTVEIDTAGDSAHLETVYSAFDLQGMSKQSVAAKIVTADLPADFTDALPFWTAQLPWLSTLDSDYIAIHDPQIDNPDSLPRYLVQGNLPEWLTSYKAQPTEISALIDYVVKDSDGNVVETITDAPISVRLNLTDARTATYSRLQSLDSGESTPTGVAAALYDSWGALHYAGHFRRIQAELDTSIRPGHALNITGASGAGAAWASMHAVVQSITENLDFAETLIELGPPAIIQADTLVALFRATRSRRFSFRQTSRDTARADADDPIDIGGSAPIQRSAAGPGVPRRIVLRGTLGEGEDQVSTHIDLNPEALAFADSTLRATSIIPREILIPELDGSTPILKLRQILAGESFGDAIPIGGGVTPQNPGSNVRELGAAAEGDSDASTASWTTGDNDGEDPPTLLGLKKFYISRLRYDHTAGTPILHAYMRFDIIDQRGFHYYTSPETRVEIDTPVDLGNP